MKFLIDVNLPRKFSFFNSEEFIHVANIDPRMKDTAIWDYARTNKLIILTKDADFYHRSSWMKPDRQSFILSWET